MTSKRQNSTTAVFLALSFLQPLPGIAQEKAKTHSGLPAEAFETALACLESFEGKKKDAETACLEKLQLADIVCDLSLLQPGGGAARADKGKAAAPERIAERIVREANVLACTSVEDQEKADAQADANLSAQQFADADASSKAQAETVALGEAETATGATRATRATKNAAKSETNGERKASPDAQIHADAGASDLPQAQTEANAEAAAAALAQAKKAKQTAASEAAARATAQSKECVVELLDAAGEALCADYMTQAEIAAVTVATTATQDAEVTTQTMTSETTRSSKQEFARPEANTSGDGLSNLERAGLLALGAVVVGTILKNGEKVTANTGDRIVVQDQYGNYNVLKDDDVLIRQVGYGVRTETFGDGSTRSFVTREDGVRIITIRDAFGQVQRRIRIDEDGGQVVLIDDTRTFAPVEIDALPIPSDADLAYRDATNRADLRAALKAAQARDFGRSFSLSQIRQYQEVRILVPEINLDNITFQTNSAAIQPSEAEHLREIGLLLVNYIREDPRELFLVEGYTDSIGDDGYNLLLSDRRAESVALALSEYFGVRPENLVVQGYGERFPLIPTLQAERLNRRVAVRRITALIQPR